VKQTERREGISKGDTGDGDDEERVEVGIEATDDKGYESKKWTIGSSRTSKDAKLRKNR